MNTLKVGAILLFALSMMHQSYAQEEITKDICDQKAELIIDAEPYLT